MSAKDWGVDDHEDIEETYWYNTKTGEVEEGPQSLGVNRLGPFATRKEAARALEIIEERARRIREEDDL